MLALEWATGNGGPLNHLHQQPHEKDQHVAAETSTVQALVDDLLAHARPAIEAGVEYSITMSREHTLHLPLDSSTLERVVDGDEGHYAGHVYRDSLVWDLDNIPEWLIYVLPVVSSESPAAEAAPSFYGDLRDGTVSSTFRWS